MFDLYVFTFHNEGQIHRSLSLLSPEEVHQHGLPTEAVLGEISALLPSMTPDQFEANEAFLTLLHTTIKELGPQLPELQAQANAQGTGYLPFLDQRAHKLTQIEQEDIVGQFQISRGEIKPDSYIPNPHYSLLTDNGPIQLPSLIEAHIIKTIHQKLEQTVLTPPDNG
jgi:hypothetical protein